MHRCKAIRLMCHRRQTHAIAFRWPDNYRRLIVRFARSVWKTERL